MKRADKNTKLLFEALKKLLDEKKDDDTVMENSSKQVRNARLAEEKGRYVSFIFEVFAESVND